MSLPSIRPADLAVEHSASLNYVVGYVNLAVQEVNRAVCRLPESRGMWDYLRATLTDMARNAGAELLASNGLKVCSPARDRFWFTLGASPYRVRVVARPQNAGKPAKSGRRKERGLYCQAPLPDAVGTVAKEKLYLMVSATDGVLESVTLTLVANPSGRWRDEGPAIIEEVTLYLADDMAISLTELPADDEDAFRSSMSRRATDDDAEAATAGQQDVETYEEHEDRDDEQAGEHDAG